MEPGGEKITCRWLQSDGTDNLPTPSAWIEFVSSTTRTTEIPIRHTPLSPFLYVGCIPRPPFRQLIWSYQFICLGEVLFNLVRGLSCMLQLPLQH